MTQAITASNLLLDPLASAVKQFDHWRVSRGKREPIPKSLWAVAVSLSTNQYGFSKIIKALKLNGSDFRKHLNAKGIISPVTPVTPVKFVECFSQASPQPINNFTKPSYFIEFTCKKSSAVKLTGLNMFEIQQVIAQLIGGA